MSIEEENIEEGGHEGYNFIENDINNCQY